MRRLARRSAQPLDAKGHQILMPMRHNPQPSGLMRRFAILFGFSCAAAVPASATDSVVLGRGLSNAFFDKIECSPTDLCMDSLYVWELDARQTLAGPKVAGRVRAIIAVHGPATSKYVRSV